MEISSKVVMMESPFMVSDAYIPQFTHFLPARNARQGKKEKPPRVSQQAAVAILT
jgi:hypothetical protein